MTTAEIGGRIREDFIVPVAEGTATSSEKIAQGSEALAQATRRMADWTRQWADEVSGARERRMIARILMAIGLAALVTAAVYFFWPSKGKKRRKELAKNLEEAVPRAS